ncbi:MFS family permease [Streptomyces tendae]|uniref:MFS transporter n=1 Tax=Streptomyces tendae TaxID=1932 RepID=UPI0038330D8C
MALLWAVAQLPVHAVAAVATLIAGRVLLGVAEGPAASMSTHALYKWFPPERHGLPSALRIGGAAIGTLVSAPVLTWLVTDFGRRSAYAVLAVVSLLCWCGGGRATTDRTTRYATTSRIRRPTAGEASALPQTAAHRDSEGLRRQLTPLLSVLDRPEPRFPVVTP